MKDSPVPQQLERLAKECRGLVLGSDLNISGGTPITDNAGDRGLTCGVAKIRVGRVGHLSSSQLDLP